MVFTHKATNLVCNSMGIQYYSSARLRHQRLVYLLMFSALYNIHPPIFIRFRQEASLPLDISLNGERRAELKQLFPDALAR